MMMSNNERNIYDRIKIVYYDESDVYGVMDLTDPLVWNTIWSGKDLETAKAVKKAYCDGYVDSKLDRGAYGESK